MVDLISENLLQAGLIQFGYFEDGQPCRLNFHLLPGYPDILQLIARRVSQLEAIKGVDRILCDRESTFVGSAVSLTTGIPLVYSRGHSDSPINTLVGAYDVGHPAVALVNCYDDPQKITRLIDPARRVGLNIKCCIALVSLQPTSPPDVDSLINFPTLIADLVADQQLPIKQATAVKNWLANLHPD